MDSLNVMANGKRMRRLKIVDDSVLQRNFHAFTWTGENIDRYTIDGRMNTLILTNLCQHLENS